MISVKNNHTEKMLNSLQQRGIVSKDFKSLMTVHKSESQHETTIV